MQTFRRWLPGRSNADGCTIELLRSSSSCHLESYNNQNVADGGVPSSLLHRNVSCYESLSNSASPPFATRPEKSTIAEARKREKKPEMNNATCVIGFVQAESSRTSSSLQSSLLADGTDQERVLTSCRNMKDSGHFSYGLLLKSVDKQPMFPFVHLAQLHNNSCAESRLYEKEGPVFAAEDNTSLGSYSEVFSIHKTSNGMYQPPANRHSGYIIVAFKLLEEHFKEDSLEQNWLNWSGAREIYKHSPSRWGLKKISLMKRLKRGSSLNQFAYVLVCEFGNILHPANAIHALDVCERMRVRNCGHISLYQVFTSYYSTHQKDVVNIPTTKRNPFLRGFSQDVDGKKVENPVHRRRQQYCAQKNMSFQYPHDHYRAHEDYCQVDDYEDQV